MDASLLGVNNGPLPYRPDLGQGNALSGGASPAGLAQFADPGDLIRLYRSMGVPGIRPNDLGGPWDLRCMFPISSTADVPDVASTYEEIRDDPRWNWDASDAVFASMLEGGFAPYLKIASREWISGIQQGFSYVGEGGAPVYVVEQQNLLNFCSNWPYISPIIEAIGDKLALAIVERYNNASMWGESLTKGGISPPGAPLESATWRGVTNATVGVELQNEYNGLTCLKTGSGDTTTLEGWRQNCGGNPYVYGWKYWDGSPGAAHRSFVSQASAIKRRFPGVMVGGPAAGTGPGFGFPDAAGGAPLDWIRDFLGTVRETSRETGLKLMDWFSWHAYTSCVIGGCNNATLVDCSADNPMSMMGIAGEMRALLDSEGFRDTPMVISEHNAPFAVNGGNSYPGNMMGAAMTAANIVGMALAKDDLGIAGAYIVNGVDGPFIPYNQNSFPLFCTPEWRNGPSNTTTNPSELIFSGRLVDNCTTGAMNINAANGMGLLYSNGDKKPTALVYEILSQFQRIRPLASASELPMSVVGYVADDADDVDDTDDADDDIDVARDKDVGGGVLKQCGRVMLVNADPFNSSPALPPLSALVASGRKPIDESIVRVKRIEQHVRAMPDVVLPNNICTAGTVQVVGRMAEASLGESGCMLANGSLVLPPAGVAVFSGVCTSDARGGPRDMGGAGTLMIGAASYALIKNLS